jgi:hypothetical protein
MTPIDLRTERAWIAQMRDDIKSFASGQRWMGEIKNGTRVNTTTKWVQELKRRLANLLNIVAANKRRKG